MGVIINPRMSIGIPNVIPLLSQPYSVTIDDSIVAFQTAATVTIPPMGPTDRIRGEFSVANYFDDGNNKNYIVKMSPNDYLATFAMTTGKYNTAYFSMKNRNNTSSQISGLYASNTGFGTVAYAYEEHTIDTSVPTTLLIGTAWGVAGTGSKTVTFEDIYVELVLGP